MGEGRTLLHVLNQYNAPKSLPLDQITELAGAEPDIVIPYSREAEANSVYGLRDDTLFKELDAGLAPLISVLSGGATPQKSGLAGRVKTWLNF
jgi:hypothetical protein